MSHETRVSGPNAAIAVEVLKTTKPDTDKMPDFVPNWWARQDSNLQPDRYERPALTS